jgi:hypothetical protein
MSFENAAVHAARPVAGGRGKDNGIYKMFKVLGGFYQTARVRISHRKPRGDLSLVYLSSFTK